MADGANLTFDLAKLTKDGDRLVRQYLSAGTAAVSGTTRRLEQRLEAATQAAVPGKLWRAWQSSRFPESGPARNPVGTIWIKGGTRTRGAVNFWTKPGEIRGKQGQFLAIPLPAAGARGRMRDLSPVEWEAAHDQELRFVARPGRAALLVADGGLNQRSGTFRRGARGRDGVRRSRVTVPIFVLLPLVKFRNAVAVAPMVAAAEGELAQAFFAAVRAGR